MSRAAQQHVATRKVLAAGRRVAGKEAPAAVGRFRHNVSGSGPIGILAARCPYHLMYG